LAAAHGVEKTGEGEAARYTAKILPTSIVGNRRYTLEQAQEDRNRQASPLPLEPTAPPLLEREPGCGDE